MKVFLIRFLIIATLFFLGAFVSGLTGVSYLALPVWYTAVSVWILTLGFRKGLAVVVPFLLLADVLWDGRIGAIFLAGFLLATLTTYVTVRIETQSRGLQMFIYSLLVGCMSSFVIGVSLVVPHFSFTVSEVMFFMKVCIFQLLVSALSFFPIFLCIHRIEQWLDTSYQEQSKKIR